MALEGGWWVEWREDGRAVIADWGEHTPFTIKYPAATLDREGFSIDIERLTIVPIAVVRAMLVEWDARR